MSCAECTNCACTTPEVVEVPGAQGDTGAAGPNEVTAATATDLTGFLTGDGANVGFLADPLAIAHGGTGAANQAAALTAVLGASTVPVANGGTGSATKAAAALALGVGQDATVYTGSGLTYDILDNAISDALTQITSVEVTVPATGIYLILARATVDYNGVTFTDDTLTLTVYNATSSAVVISTDRVTQSPTATDFPSFDYVVPFVTATLTAGHEIQLRIRLSALEAAGSSKVSAASLAIVPLYLS